MEYQREQVLEQSPALPRSSQGFPPDVRLQPRANNSATQNKICGLSYKEQVLHYYLNFNASQCILCFRYQTSSKF